MTRNVAISIVWREAICDTKLTSTVKAAVLAHSVHMNEQGVHFTGRKRLARDASISVRSIDAANATLRTAGWLAYEDQKGGRNKTNTYTACLPETANEVRRSDWLAATQRANALPGSAGRNGAAHNRKGAAHGTKGARAAPEVVEVDGNRRRRANVDATVARAEDYCRNCKRDTLHTVGDDVCTECGAMPQ